MDYSRWTEMQPNPPIDPYAPPIYHSHYPYYSHHPQNPNPNPSLPDPHASLKPHDLHSSIYGVGLDAGLRPPGIDSYPSISSYPSVSSYPHSHGGTYEAQPSVAYAHQTVDTGSLAVPSAYYHDPSAVVAQQNWAEKEVIRQFGAIPHATGVTIPPNGTEQLVPANPNPTLWTNPTARPRGNGTWRKAPKKTKIVQSAWCEVCKIDCNSRDVLEQHKLGKKHQKNLDKLKEAAAPVPVASAESNNPVIGPLENPDKGKAVGGQKMKKKSAEPVEDLDTKRRKIMEGGAAADAVRACAICNVVCNSETVFNYHLVGQKHTAMVKKHAAVGTGVATAT